MLGPLGDQKQGRLSQHNPTNQASYIDQSLSEGLKQHSSVGPSQQQLRSNLYRSSDIDADPEAADESNFIMHQFMNL